MSILFISLQSTERRFDMPVRSSDVYGEWAVHRNPNGNGWRVSHTSTGRSLSRLADDMTKQDAIKIARRINRAIPILRVTIIDRFSPDGAIVPDEDRRMIEAIVAEVVGS